MLREENIAIEIKSQGYECKTYIANVEGTEAVLLFESQQRTADICRGIDSNKVRKLIRKPIIIQRLIDVSRFTPARRGKVVIGIVTIFPQLSKTGIGWS